MMKQQKINRQNTSKISIKNSQKHQPYQIPSISFQFIDQNSQLSISKRIKTQQISSNQVQSFNDDHFHQINKINLTKANQKNKILQKCINLDIKLNRNFNRSTIENKTTQINQRNDKFRITNYNPQQQIQKTIKRHGRRLTQSSAVPLNYVFLSQKQQKSRRNVYKQLTRAKRQQNQLKKSIINIQNTRLKTNQSRLQDLIFRQKKKPMTGLSKSIMVSKIINLRKIFNQKYKKGKTTQFQSRSRNSPQKSCSQLGITLVNENSQNPLRKHQFEVYLPDQNKKMSFQQLFAYQQKKMEFLKKCISQNKISQIQCFNQLIPSFRQVFDYDKSKIVFNLSRENKFERTDSIITEKTQVIQGQKQYNQKQHANYFINIDQFQIGKPEKRASTYDVQRQHRPNENSPQHIKQKYSIKKYDFEFNRQKKNKNSEINELRHKYLHANHRQINQSSRNRRKFSKQQCIKYGISIAAYEKQIKNPKQKNFEGIFVSIKKKKSIENKNDYRMTANFQKKSRSQIKPEYERPQKRLNTTMSNLSFNNLDPWQSSNPHQINQNQHF